MVTTSSLWRTCLIALFIALVGNILLARISSDDDWFANVIAVASGIAAIGLVAARFYHRIIEFALGLSFIIWVANAIEFALEELPRWETQVRQGSFYVAFAVVSLGCWLSVRDRRYGL